MKKIAYLLLLVIGLAACDNDPCKGGGYYASTNILIANCPTPQKAELYVYANNNSFSNPEVKSVRNGNFNVQPEFVFLDFDVAFFQKDKDYRVVLNDTIFFDIGNTVFAKHVDSAHWTMGGPSKSCATAYFEVNGIPVEEEYLHTTYFQFPYDLHKVFKKIYPNTSQFTEFENKAAIKCKQAEEIYKKHLPVNDYQMSASVLFYVANGYYFFGEQTNPTQDKMQRSFTILTLKINAQTGEVEEIGDFFENLRQPKLDLTNKL